MNPNDFWSEIIINAISCEQRSVRCCAQPSKCWCKNVNVRIYILLWIGLQFYTHSSCLVQELLEYFLKNALHTHSRYVPSRQAVSCDLHFMFHSADSHTHGFFLSFFRLRTKLDCLYVEQQYNNCESFSRYSQSAVRPWWIAIGTESIYY